MYFKYNIHTHINKPSKDLEPFILNRVSTAYEYSKKVLKKRWSKAEKEMLKIGMPNSYSADLEYIYLYAKNVIKSRWPKGEKTLLNYVQTQQKASVLYRSEPLSAVAKFLCLYAKYVVKGRWKEAEEFILHSNQIGFYLSILKNEKDLKEFKTAIQLNCMRKNDYAENYFTWKPTHRIKVKGKKAFDVMIAKVDIPGSSPKNNPMDLVFMLEEWLDQAKTFNNKGRCYTYYKIKVDNETEKLSDRLYKGNKYYRLRKTKAEVFEI